MSGRCGKKQEEKKKSEMSSADAVIFSSTYSVKMGILRFLPSDLVRNESGLLRNLPVGRGFE